MALRELQARNQNEESSIRLQGQILCIPWLIHQDVHPNANERSSAPQQNADAPILPMPQLRHFVYLMRVENPADPEFNIGLATPK